MPGILRNFAVEMLKRGAHILLSVVLATTILLFGAGVDVVRCSHSGAVQLLLGTGNGGDNGCCPTGSDCMTVEHVQLQPSVEVQAAHFDFHILQPIVAPLASLAGLWPPCFTEPVRMRACYIVRTGPPRSYLRLLRVLLI